MRSRSTWMRKLEDTDDEYIGMVWRKVLDAFIRERAEQKGMNLINGLFMLTKCLLVDDEPYVLLCNDFEERDGDVCKGVEKTFEVDVVIGVDGENSRVAEDIEASVHEYVIAFSVDMRFPEEKTDYHSERSEMYVGEDAMPDLYAWVLPKAYHVAMDSGAAADKQGIQKYQWDIWDCAQYRISGGEILRAEAHPIPEHLCPWCGHGCAALVGNAAGYVTKCSGDGIGSTAKSGFMCVERIVECSDGGPCMTNGFDSYDYINKSNVRHGSTYLVLDALQEPSPLRMPLAGASRTGIDSSSIHDQDDGRRVASNTQKAIHTEARRISW